MKEQNNHHLLFPRADWNTAGRLPAKLRRDKSLILPVPIESHIELHRNLFPKFEPQIDVVLGLAKVIKRTNDFKFVDKFERVDFLADYLRNTNFGYKCSRRFADQLGDHLGLQIKFLRGN